MTTLSICLAGPMQAWGAASRFTNRETRPEPTKSGVLGLLAAAQGIRRTESIEHLLGLSFGVRIDQPGTLMRDFQVARSLDGKRTMPLSNRYYLADAIFVSAVEGEKELVQSLSDAIKRPAYPLYLGRRSCPPSRPLFLEVSDAPMARVLESTPWQASADYRGKQGKTVGLRIVVDGRPGSGDTVRDVPVSFDPRRREYAWRHVEERWVAVENADGRDLHDPMAILGGA
ncbi:type I-E CRISPR-associated protein Cas5/CasD [Gordonia sp. VNQ95]|uniref:type I-E CRISPR-associated protein Cas5/CasD n=1 Tax=Gordonia TaxID=2053 RepID=UPI0032B4DA12